MSAVGPQDKNWQDLTDKDVDSLAKQFHISLKSKHKKEELKQKIESILKGLGEYFETEQKINASAPHKQLYEYRTTAKGINNDKDKLVRELFQKDHLAEAYAALEIWPSKDDDNRQQIWIAAIAGAPADQAGYLIKISKSSKDDLYHAFLDGLNGKLKPKEEYLARDERVIGADLKKRRAEEQAEAIYEWYQALKENGLRIQPGNLKDVIDILKPLVKISPYYKKILVDIMRPFVKEILRSVSYT